MPLSLEAVAVLIACRLPGGLEAGDGAAGEPGQEEQRVVHGHRPCAFPGLHAGRDTPRGRARHLLPLLDERLGHRTADLGDVLTGDEAGHVDDMGVQIAVGTRAGAFFLKPPDQGDRLIGPVLKIEGPDVPDGPQRTVLDQLVRQGDGRATAVVVPDEGLDPGLLGRLDHRAGLGQRAGDRFLARDILAGLDGGHGHRGVHEVGRHDVNQVDLGRA